MWFELGYQLLGGLGLFFFGMKILSEALQAMAGDLIRKVINLLTTNRFMAVAVGAFVTCLVQSSSVTTVMVVGLVNANLMELTQAIGVIFGANIGTTITGWILALHVGKYGLLFVGLGIFPFLFSKSTDYRSLGKLLIALGFVFMGLDTMSEALKPLRHTDSFRNLMVYFSADTFRTYLACVGMGALLTCIIQSSSAMLGVTVALASTGAISFQTACALVLGENIGTTITALLASVNTNSNARRAARAHALFNIIGVLWMTPLFWKYIQFIDWIIPGVPDLTLPDGSKPHIAAHIASSHSMFNILNTIVFLPFVNQLARLVTFLTKTPPMKEVAHLKYIPSTTGASPAMALAAAEKELANLAKMVKSTFEMTREYVLAEKIDRKLGEKIEKYEEITDSIQAEITKFLCNAMEGDTHEETALGYSIIRAADELESIADYCAALARYRRRLNESGQPFTEAEFKDLQNYFALVYDFFIKVEKKVSTNSWDLDEIYSESKSLKKVANQIWEDHKNRLSSGASKPVSGMLFSDFIVGLRKIKSHSVNVAEALCQAPISDH